MANQPASQSNGLTNICERLYEKLSPEVKEKVLDEAHLLLTDHRTAPRQKTIDEKDRQAPKI